MDRLEIIEDFLGDIKISFYGFNKYKEFETRRDFQRWYNRYYKPRHQDREYKTIIYELWKN